MLNTSLSMNEVNNNKRRLSLEFERNDLGEKKILGMKISRDKSVGILNISHEQ